MNHSSNRSPSRQSPSKSTRADFRSPRKKEKSRGFPTTPRSAEKQKNTLMTKLRRLMEQNLRLAAQNQSLKQNNKHLLDGAVVSRPCPDLCRPPKSRTTTRRSC